MNYSWELDNFDSEVFGFKVAKIQRVKSESVKDLIKDLLKNGIGYATLRIQSNNFSVIHALEKSGFVLVDGLISFSLMISDIEVTKIPSEIREANNNDLVNLKKLTSGLFSTGRVMSDPFIPKNKATQFYVKWIENSILRKVADLVLVWEEKDLPAGRQGEILGYISLQKKGQIPLVGVSIKARGKGIGKKLIEASLNKFKEWNIEAVVIETQIDNALALNLYQRAGFKIVNSFLTLRWAKDD